MQPRPRSGVMTPYRMIGVILHGFVSPVSPHTAVERGGKCSEGVADPTLLPHNPQYMKCSYNFCLEAKAKLWP